MKERERNVTRASTMRSSRRRGSLGRTLLIAFLLLTLVPLIGISAVTIWRQYNNSRTQIINQLTSVATLKETEVKNWFNSLSPDLELVVADPRVRSDITELIAGEHNEIQLAGWRSLLLDTLRIALVSGNKFDELFLMDTTGTVIVSTNPSREGGTFEVQSFFREGLNTPYVQSPFYSPLYDEVVVFAAVPVRDESGVTRGVLAGAASLDALNDIMQERAGLGQTGETYLVNSDCIMLTEPRAAQSGEFQSMCTLGAAQALSGIDGAELYKNYQSPPVPVVGVYRWIPELNVALLAEQSQAEAFALARQNIWITLGVTLVTAALTIGAVVIVTRSIAGPLEHLTSIATRMAEGNLGHTALIGRNDEIGTLADAFNTMTIQLRELIGDLEERVAARTAEMEAQQEALRKSEQKLSLHVQQTPLAVIEWNLSFEVTEWNPGAEKIFGYSRAEAIGRHAVDLVVLEDVRGHVDKVWDDLLAKRGGMRSTNENVTKDGRIIICEWYNTPLIDQDGNVISVASLAQDITDRKKAEEELHKAKEAAETASRAKSAFLSMVSHELRTPLTSVLGFAKLIGKRLDGAIFPVVTTDDPKVRQAIRQVGSNLDIIVSEGERLTALINDMLDLAKIEAGKVEWDMQPVSVQEIIERSLMVTASLFTARSLKLVVDVEPELPVITGDRDRLIQVLVNLISNAVKFTDEGSVTCQARRVEDEIVVSVIDTGIGIASEDRDKVFEQFVQVGDTLTGKPKGTGLGLPICRHIVNHHSGRIWVESQLGRGANFSFALPIC